MLATVDLAHRESLRPLLELVATEAERADRERRLPVNVVEAARAAGLFRLALPRSMGGIGADLPRYLDLLTDISGAYGSMGWCLAVVAGTTHAILTQFPPEQAAPIAAAIAGGAIVTGTLPPLGTAQPVAGGYRVSGRWPFASLTEHADLRTVGAVAPGPPPPDADRRLPGDRHLRFCVVPRETPGVTLHDTWHSLVMQGSGSCDLELTDVFVPEQRSAPVGWYHYRPDFEGMLRVPFHITQGLSLAAIACGIARAALDAFIARARQPRGSLPAAATVPTVQLAVAEAAVDLAAGDALLRREVAHAWSRAAQPEPIAPEERTPWWIAAHGATAAAVRAVDRLFSYSGAHAVYDHVPLQRYFRDVRVPLHHIHLHPGETANDIGRTLLGLPPERYNW